MRFETFPYDLAAALPDDAGVPAGAPQLLSGDGDVHPEDAFLGEHHAFLRRTLRLTPSERAVADELVRAALDHAGAPDGDFSTLPVDAWLAAALPLRARERVSHDAFGRLALAFVAFLSSTGRIAPLAARRLRRDIAGIDVGTVARAA